MRILISIMMLVCLTLDVSAQSTYFYAGTKKISLYENQTKAIVRTPKGQASQIKVITTIKPLRTIACDSYDMTVVEKKSTDNINTILSLMPSTTTGMMVYPCYKNAEGDDVVPTSYIYVELKNAADKTKLTSTAAKYGCKILKQNKFMPLWYTLSMQSYSSTDAVEIAKKIKETNLFSNAYPAFEIEQMAISYDPLVSGQWGLYNPDYEDIDISASNAWNYATGRGVTVAVVDNGIELTHEDLVDNILPDSYDACTGTSPSVVHRCDDTSHGTRCAGIIGAARNNNIGISGVAPEVNLLSVSAKYGSPDIADQLADAINWAWQNGADIISCSWGGRTEEPFVTQAIDQAVSKGRGNKGCIVVFAAGNCPFPGGGIMYPANSRDDIIQVGNLEKSGMWNYTSCVGDRLLVMAPGTDILSTCIDNTYGEACGTSLAAPHVSGIVALMLEINPQLTVSEAREILAKKAKKIGHVPYTTDKPYGKWNEIYGYGLVDASEAVKETLNRVSAK